MYITSIYGQKTIDNDIYENIHKNRRANRKIHDMHHKMINIEYLLCKHSRLDYHHNKATKFIRGLYHQVK